MDEYKIESRGGLSAMSTPRQADELLRNLVRAVYHGTTLTMEKAIGSAYSNGQRKPELYEAMEEAENYLRSAK